PTAGGGARPAAPVRDTRQPSQVSYKPWAILSFVVGAAAVTGGAIMGMKADDSADQFNNSVSRNEKRNLKDDVEFQATAANVLYGVGAAGIVIGALLWSLDPADSYAEVAPMPGGGAYVGWGGTF
ncbi:MAG: hypothetical protein KC620_14260, partial [Myxococcales bacterium]|nr:hypothetical protein [Myxococcales bacterium]